MKKFILVTTFFCGWAFYEMSGGADFDPSEGVVKAAQAAEVDAMEQVSSTPIVSTKSGKMQIPAKPEQAAKTAKADAVLPVVKDLPLVVVTKTAAQAELIESFKQARAVTPEPAGDIRKVAGSSVNLRAGPGTSHAVLTSLGEGRDVEILEEPGNGWVKLRTTDGASEGWMADWLVTAAD